jgi:hypothetical protein
MKQFENAEMMAPNVLRVSVDIGRESRLLKVLSRTGAGQDYAEANPGWNSDVRWVSARTRSAFLEFESEFERIGAASHVEPYLDLDTSVRLYSGFLVTRSYCRRPDFHVDWIDTDNEAFTLLTPLTPNAADFGLLYERSDGRIAEYRYKIGEALIFGDGFLHATKPGQSDEPVVLLSFTFGTDKMEHWHKISRTAGTQGELICLPDGSFQEARRRAT